MGGVETGLIGRSPSVPDAKSRFRLLALVLGTSYAAYCLAAVLGAPSSVVSPLFSAFMLPVPGAVWWAYARAPSELRRLILLLAWAASLWLIGSLVWYGYYFAGGSAIPEPPGTWDVFFLLARLLVIAAVVEAMRSVISFRIAALDACVITAATVALGAAFISRGFEQGVSAAALVTLNRPILGIVTLMLLVAAALGSWQGLPLSISLMGLGEVALTAGSMIYSYQAIQGAYVDDRWAGLGWAGGAALSILAASVVILRIDRPVRLSRAGIPNHAAGSRPVLLVSLAALALTLGVTAYGLQTQTPTLSLVGVIAAVSIATAMVLRARDSIRTAEQAYVRLDRALVDAERTRDQLEGVKRGARQGQRPSSGDAHRARGAPQPCGRSNARAHEGVDRGDRQRTGRSARGGARAHSKTMTRRCAWR